MDRRKLTRKEKIERQREQPKADAASGRNKKAKSRIAVHGFIIAVFGFLLYANSLPNDFALDDISAIKKNWVVKQGMSSFPLILKTSYRFGYRASDDELYRPLPLMIYATLWQFFPGNPFPFHLLNVLLYAITGLVLFNLLKKLFKDIHPLLPFVATLLFIAHPLHTEVVANIKSLDEILSFLLVLLTVGQLFLYIEKKKASNLFLSWILFFLAFLCKEGTIVMLAVIPLILVMFSDASKGKNIQITLLLASAAVIFIALRANALGGFATGKKFMLQENVLVSAPDTGIRLATVFYVIFQYFRVMLVPYPLSCDYSFREMGLSSWSELTPWISLIIYASILVFAVMSFRKNKILAFAILFFLGTIVLYSNLLMTIGSLFAERFLYVPLLGFTIVVSWLLIKLLKVQDLNQVHKNGDPVFNTQNQKLLVVVVILLIPCSYITIARNADWKDTVTLFSADIVKAPESALLNYNYASELKAELAPREQDLKKKTEILEKAVVHYKKALEIYPGYNEVLEQLGLAYYYLGKDSDAFVFISKAIEEDPLRSTAYNSLGTWYFEKTKNYQKALELYLYAVKLNPNYIDGWRNTGAAYGTLGQFDKALDAFNRVLLLDPQNVTVLNFIAQTYRSLGDQGNADFYAQKARAAEKVKH